MTATYIVADGSTTTGSAASGGAAKLRAGGRRAFLSTRFAGQVGQGMFYTALLIIAGTGDAMVLSVSAVVIATTAGALLVGLPAGALVDRIGARRGLVIGAVLRLVVVLSLLLALGHGERIWMVAFAYSAVSQIFSPSEMALVSSMGSRGASRAHAWLVGLQHAGSGLGIVALAPLFFFVGGMPGIILGAAAVYVLTTGLSLLVLRAVPELPKSERPSTSRAFDITATLRFFRSEPRATYAAGVLAFAETASKSLLATVPLYLQQELNFDIWGVGLIVAVGVTGALLGLIWAGRHLNTAIAPRVLRLAALAAVIAVLALAGLSEVFTVMAGNSRVAPLEGIASPLVSGVIVALPVALVLGAFISIVPVAARTVLTQTAPAGQQARVFATQAVSSDLLSLIPVGLVGLSAEFAGARFSLLLIGLIGVMTLLVLERVNRRSAVAAAVPAPAPVSAA